MTSKSIPASKAVPKWTAAVALLGAILVPSPSSSESQVDPVRLTEMQTREETRLLKKTLERIHPGYRRYATEAEINEGWKRLDAESVGGAELGSWYREISHLLARLRCEHSRAELPKEIETIKQREPSFLPFRFRLFGDRMFVAESAPDSGLRRGDEVLAVEGRPIAEILAALRPFVPVDGWGDALRNASLEVDGDFLGSSFEQFYALLFGKSPTVSLRLAGKTKDTVLNRLVYDDWLALTGPNTRRYLDFKDAVTARDLDETTAYLEVDTFVNYRNPVDPLDLLAPHFRRWNEEGKKRLIVDLRANGGGSDDAMNTLLRLLAKREFETTSEAYLVSPDPGDDLMPYLSSWEASAVKTPQAAVIDQGDGMWRVRPSVLGTGRRTVKPHEDHFRGEVVALTSRFNGSATANLFLLLKDNGLATLVGEATGGNTSGVTAGFIVSLKLPHSGIVVRVPRLLQPYALKNPDRFKTDSGVEPDHRVEPSQAGFLAGRDEILEAAVALPR